MYEFTNYDIDFKTILDKQVRSHPQTDVTSDIGAYIREDGLSSSGIVSNGSDGKSILWNIRGGIPSTSSAVAGRVASETSLDILSTVKGSDEWSWYNVRLNKTWNYANQEAVAKNLNPNNFDPNSKQMYQFLKLSRPAGLTAIEINNNLLVGMGSLSNQGQAFIDAANRENVNEIYLLSHALLETGNGKSELSNGSLQVNGKTVYNMFGIGAYDSCPKICGSEYAYNAGWFTPEEAIIGGAKYIANSYIKKGQDTLYKMRWNPANPGIHQYATDIGWASKQTTRMANLYSLLGGNVNLVFDIPKFKNQPGKTPDYSESVSILFPQGIEGYVSSASGKLRSGSSTQNSEVATLTKNTIVQVIGSNTDSSWYQVNVAGVKGWISSDVLQVINLLKVNVGTSLNVRSQPMSNSSTIGSLANNSLVSGIVNGGSISKVGKWYKVNYQGKEGWLNSDFISPSSKVSRLDGATLYETSALISQAGWDQSDVVIIARGDRFSDALAGVPLAAKYNAPLLLSRKDSLDTHTKSELQRLSVKRVIILGGPLAIDPKVEEEIKKVIGTNGKVDRFAGANLHETAQLISKDVAPNGSNKVIVVSDTNFQDALSIASYAGNEGIPILLANKTFLPKETAAALKQLGAKETIVMGGHLAIDDSVFGKLPKPIRIAGATMYDTNILALKHFQPTLNKVYIATSNRHEDGLSGAALAAKEKAGVIIVGNSLHQTTSTHLSNIIYQEAVGIGGVLAIPHNLMLNIQAEVN